MSVDGVRCTRCGRAWVPTRDACAACAGPVTAAVLPSDGEVLSWTRVHVAPEGFGTPYVVGVVRLPDTQVIAVAEDAEDPRIGDRVRVRVTDTGTLAFGPA